MLRAGGFSWTRASGLVWSAVNARGSNPKITERQRFERKKAENTLQAASRFLFLGSREDIRWVYGVPIKPVIGRGDLRVGIIDMGLGV